MANVAKLLMLQGGKCFYCGNKLSLEDATVDHVVAKALGGDNSEGNTVACCHSINHAFGNATAKEKLQAIINGGGRIECPATPIKKAQPPVTPPTTVGTIQQPNKSKPIPVKPNNQKSTPVKKPSSLRQALQEAFQTASAVNDGKKAILTAVSLELRARIPDFKVKEYGQKSFANLVKCLGYKVEKEWCFPSK